MSKIIVVIDEVLERLCQLLDCKNDTELATALNVGRTTVSSWRTRGSIPYSECVEVAIRESVLLDWIITGREPMRLSECVAETHGHYGVVDESIIKDYTQRVIAIAKERPGHPDIMQLGSLRDLAVTARLDDDQIKVIFGLLEKAGEIYND